MRYAILSDVHANVEALSAVLDDARAAGAASVVCLGDVVGYHADPDACIALLRALCDGVRGALVTSNPRVEILTAENLA